ncbi:MAG: enoyl-CoA hydratase/isomerase family protein [Chloroflexota bacterium]|nr:enoyl-CoA hydratase/isomerase family protein [Chloroflexota bacterium]
MNGFETIIYEKIDGTATVTLNRPEVLNRYNIKMRDELYEVLSAIKDDPDILVVVFRGAGERAFCVGADLSEFGTAPSPLIARQVRWERDVWGLFATLKQPLIAALHGYVLGSGVEIALLCDIRIASDDALFGLPEVSLGMIPAAGGSQTLPRAIGYGKALHLLLSCDRIDAGEALRVGLVNRVVKREELFAVTDMLAQKIKLQNSIAVSYAKESIRRGLDLTLGDGLVLEKRLAEAVKVFQENESLTITEEFS